MTATQSGTEIPRILSKGRIPGILTCISHYDSIDPSPHSQFLDSGVTPDTSSMLLKQECFRLIHNCPRQDYSNISTIPCISSDYLQRIHHHHTVRQRILDSGIQEVFLEFTLTVVI